MNPGTNARNELLSNAKLADGRKFQLGAIGIVNRTQEDVANQKVCISSELSTPLFFLPGVCFNLISGLQSIAKHLDGEAKFFLKEYTDLARNNGIPFLARRLNEQVGGIGGKSHCSSCRVGEAVADPRNTVLDILKRYSDFYSGELIEHADGVTSNELDGGARINSVFHDDFAQALMEIPPLDSLTLQEGAGSHVLTNKLIQAKLKEVQQTLVIINDVHSAKVLRITVDLSGGLLAIVQRTLAAGQFGVFVRNCECRSVDALPEFFIIAVQPSSDFIIVVQNIKTVKLRQIIAYCIVRSLSTERATTGSHCGCRAEWSHIVDNHNEELRTLGSLGGKPIKHTDKFLLGSDSVGSLW
ncbi:hypothetical protein BV898_05009 [Hypsibius exemplaris]|uniref:Uncharacterized protein n=1 Tax=Hypsibius exemplaris TaxID=2072580 RepID=A0A1W0X0D2_HYPEX|nr:hypothetical protein BV898_05009 [Hypsibius exemplaris]